MIILKARFDGRAFVPESPVDLPAGCEVELSITPPAASTATAKPLAALAQIAYLYPDNPDYPPDFAAQHDHYLYGLPKRP